MTREILRVVDQIKEESDLKELKRLLEKYGLPSPNQVWRVPGLEKL